MSTKSERTHVYQQYLIATAPLLLSHLNRDPYSPLYGSFDRAHWSWQSKDFSNADLQRGIFPLTILYSNNFDSNEYFKNQNILTWIEAALDFWVNLQNRNGSFDQWYPRECSAGTAAFTLYPLSEAYLVLKDELSGSIKKKLIRSFQKAALFIVQNQESHGFISNHRAGMAAALANASFILDNPTFLDSAKSIVAEIKSKQSKEGWFTEYGGADPGYESLGISYLAGYFNRTRDKSVLGMIEKSVSFYVNFIHPDRSVGGEYGSRNAELYFPAGLESISTDNMQANVTLNHMLPSILNSAISTPATVDLYNFIPLIDNYAHAYKYSINTNTKQKDDYVLPCFDTNNTVKYYPISQLAIMKDERFYLVAGLSKGGVVKIFDRHNKRLLYDNCGIYAELDNGKSVTTQMLDFDREINVTDTTISVSGNLYYMRKKSQNPPLFIVFRLVTMTAGFLSILNKLIKIMVSAILIKAPGKSSVQCTRKIFFEDNTITISDTIDPGRSKIKRLESGRKFVSIFMGSSRYFQKNELVKKSPDTFDVDPSKLKTSATITDVITLAGSEPTILRSIN